MNGSLDVHADLAAAVRDAPGAWRFIRRFAAHHATPIVAGDGFGEEDLLAAEARLGFTLPASLRAVYALLGRRDDLTRNQDRLLTPDEITLDDDGQVLVFRVENQSVALWGIPLPALTEKDPPVVVRLESPAPAERAWRPFLERVSLACVEMVLSEWLFATAQFTDNRELDAETITLLEKQFHRLPMPGYPQWGVPEGGPVRWFEGRGAILRDDGGTWVWARAGSTDEIATVRRVLPGDWMLDPG